MTENLYTPNCIRTYTGRYLNLQDPKPEDIYPVDIAVGLSRECRFGNHTKRFYSVSEHSVECMNAAERMYPEDKHLAFRCLMHDAHEAYIGDAPTPLGNLLGPLWVEMKRKIQDVINTRFGLSRTDQDIRVKEIDKLTLEFEWKNKVLGWSGLNPLPEKENVDIFIHHFVRLCKNPFVLQP